MQKRLVNHELFAMMCHINVSEAGIIGTPRVNHGVLGAVLRAPCLEQTVPRVVCLYMDVLRHHIDR